MRRNAVADLESATRACEGTRAIDGRAQGEPRRWRRRRGKKKKAKRKRGWVYLNGWGWDPTEEFVIERLIGKMVADGGDVPGREGEEIAAGTVLYKVLWEGWPAGDRHVGRGRSDPVWRGGLC